MFFQRFFNGVVRIEEARDLGMFVWFTRLCLVLKHPANEQPDISMPKNMKNKSTGRLTYPFISEGVP